MCALAVAVAVAICCRYAAIGRGAYYVPTHRVARLPLLNRFTRTNEWALAVEERLNRGREPAHRITHGLHLLSRLADGYQDLAELDARLGDPPPGPDAAAAAPAAASTAGNNNAGLLLLVPRPLLACLKEAWVPQSRARGGWRRVCADPPSG